MYRVNANLRVRSAPNGDIIGLLNKDAQVLPLSITDGWARLGEGMYVSAAYMTNIDVKPEPTPEPEPPKWRLPFTAVNRFVHASAGGWAPSDHQLDLVEQNHVTGVLIVAYEPNQQHAISMFRSAGVKHFIIRAATHDEYQHVPDAATFVERTLPRLKQYALAFGSAQDMMIQIGNEPNLYKEGYSHRWTNGTQFAEWWVAVAEAYRKALPGCKLGFPAMSPGGNVTGIRGEEELFIRQAKYAIERSDWAGVHYYWADPNDPIDPPDFAWKRWFGSLPLVATEVGPGDQTVTTSAQVLRAYNEFARLGVPCVAWLLNGAGMWSNAAWDKQGIVVP